MMQHDRTAILRELHRSLHERWRPEDVAQQVLKLLDFEDFEKSGLENAARAAEWNPLSSMSTDFSRPCNMSRQLKTAQELFGGQINFAADDVKRIEAWIKCAEQSIGKTFGRNDFKADRLSKEDRKRTGIDGSRRQYNKRFRLAVRLERKTFTLAREQFKRSLTLASKSRLASKIGWTDFSSDPNTACFIAYYVARCNLRSMFTNSSQVRPYDEICEMLMQRCRRNQDQTNWRAIAHAMPAAEVLRRLDDQRKGMLLAEYFQLMHEAACFLEELWTSNRFCDDMVVQRGNDSTTWNVAAGAWNKLRDGWFSLAYDLGLQDAVEQICPGKVLRLMAADVACWHRHSGGDVHPDTLIWNEIPRPWKVVSGDESCPKSLVDGVCAKYGLDPVKSGWSAPRPPGAIAQFTPTPELVHGVVVESPLLASIFRKAGVFSGKQAKSEIRAAAVDEVRSRHMIDQEHRRNTMEQMGQSDDESSAV